MKLGGAALGGVVSSGIGMEKGRGAEMLPSLAACHAGEAGEAGAVSGAGLELASSSS